MRFAIVLTFLISVTYAGDLKEYVAEFKTMIKEIGTNCLEEVGATNDDLDSILIKKEIPTKHEAMCLILCVHKKLGIQNSEGKFDFDASVKSIAPLEEVDADMYEKAKKTFKTCMDKAGDDADPCVTAVAMAKCGKEEAERMGVAEAYDI